MWSAWIASKANAGAEYRTTDGSRVDVLLPAYAAEVEWCAKWEQAVGQSLFYAAATNRKPRIILLYGRRTREKDDKDYLRCLVVCQRVGIRLDVVNINRAKWPPD